MLLVALSATKAAADSINFIDICTLHSWLGEAGMARTDVRRCEKKSGSEGHVM